MTSTDAGSLTITKIVILHAWSFGKMKHRRAHDLCLGGIFYVNVNFINFVVTDFVFKKHYVRDEENCSIDNGQGQ